ncbi:MULTISPECIES: hypothetical protein [unclassified Pseudoclavibacter]|uniref:hypothetical protein n=1 Tax=unclassified Pseudoclavibacter TaxID=2615177 RepID=UPI001BAB3EAF|nr:hypothetical protein [Pseudoclavibacter sp. Marseille-Q4354]MBS3180034.1 hypothetical protein [Pseudoclavibacter sp. Marseille-Q4354]
MSDAIEVAKNKLARELAREESADPGDPTIKLAAVAAMQSEIREVGVQEAVDACRATEPPITWSVIAERLGLGSPQAAIARYGPGADEHRAKAAVRSARRDALAASARGEEAQELPGMSVADAAAEVGITEANARVKLSRIRKAAAEGDARAEAALAEKIAEITGPGDRKSVRILDLSILGSQRAHS